MLYHLSIFLKGYISSANVLHYVSFRVVLALFTAFGLTVLLGPSFIAFSERWFRAKARDYAPEHHKLKDNIPTMGGLLIVAVTIISVLLWCNLMQPEVWLLLICLILFAGLGFWDDWSKITTRKGISETLKFRAQLLLGLFVAALWYFWAQPYTYLSVPFFKNITIELGIFFIAWVVFMIIATSNAVNLTDGLDGLAISSLIMNFGTFSIIAYVAGHAVFAHYLQIPHVETAEVAIVGATLVGASLGFLWYNAYPARMFMGDVGSLSLGATLALMALMTKQEFVLAISGGLFVVETLSVMLQVVVFKKWGRRFFKMAPLHHHFELIGWHEPTIMIRFAVITFLLCLLALLTLKLR